MTSSDVASWPLAVVVTGIVVLLGGTIAFLWWIRRRTQKPAETGKYAAIVAKAPPINYGGTSSHGGRDPSRAASSILSSPIVCHIQGDILPPPPSSRPAGLRGSTALQHTERIF